VHWDASGIDPTADGRRLALVTCWPLHGKFSGPLRYVVYAQMIDDFSARPRASGNP
jgi:sortase A